MNALGALEPDAFRHLLRRLTVTAIVLGVLGTVVALFLDLPLGALGIALGVTAGFWNVRLLDRHVSRVDVDSTASRKALRRMVSSRSLLRLSILTVVSIALVVVEPPLGIGIVVGLVIFQLAFVGNVLRVMVAQGGIG